MEAGTAARSAGLSPLPVEPLWQVLAAGFILHE
jgi:hypothetical protein